MPKLQSYDITQMGLVDCCDGPGTSTCLLCTLYTFDWVQDWQATIELYFQLIGHIPMLAVVDKLWPIGVEVNSGKSWCSLF